MKTFIKENIRLTRDIIDFGWGNGYALIPQGHPMHGKSYDDIDVNIHDGLTFAALVDDEMVKSWELDPEDKGKWCVGFDTFHCDDTLSNWPEKNVLKEANNLGEQLELMK